jgi:hypothetical protein
VDNARVVVGSTDGDTPKYAAYDPGGMFYIDFDHLPSYEEVKTEIKNRGFESESY